MERWRTPIVERRARMTIQMQCYVGMEFRVSRKVVSHDASAVRSFEVNIIPPAPTELPHVSPARKLCRGPWRCDTPASRAETTKNSSHPFPFSLKTPSLSIHYTNLKSTPFTMDHSHMDHSHMDHGHEGHNMPGMDHGHKCNMNVWLLAISVLSQEANGANRCCSHGLQKTFALCSMTGMSAALARCHASI